MHSTLRHFWEYIAEYAISNVQALYLTQAVTLSAASGQYGISAHMLKSAAGAVVPSVTKLFNLSAQLEQLPQTWCVEYHGKQS